jgi:hypothetical protein
MIPFIPINLPVQSTAPHGDTSPCCLAALEAVVLEAFGPAVVWFNLIHEIQGLDFQYNVYFSQVETGPHLSNHGIPKNP